MAASSSSATAAAAASTIPLVLVTGASGFVATHCVHQLLAAGYRVRGTVREPDNAIKTEPLRSLPGAAERLELVSANLTSDAGWPEAVRGCEYVLHVASPFPSSLPKHEDELIRPAVDGTLRVLRAAAAEPGVRRVVITSSVAAVSSGYSREDKAARAFTEADWSRTEGPVPIDPYPKSKTLAEQAAWRFVREEQPAGRGLELAVINPSFILGPMIRKTECTSVEVLRKILQREAPAIPDLHFSAVDVRDVARAHILAMRHPEAAGKRFILSTASYPMLDMARDLAVEFDPKGYSVPTWSLPNFFIGLLACFDPQVAMIQKNIGVKETFDNSRARTILGMELLPVRQAAIETAWSGVRHGLVRLPSGGIKGGIPAAPELPDPRVDGIRCPEAL